MGQDHNKEHHIPDTQPNKNHPDKNTPHAPGYGSDKQHPDTPPKKDIDQ